MLSLPSIRACLLRVSRGGLAVAFVAAVCAGCASAPVTTGNAQDAAITSDESEAVVETRVVPSDTRTLYEQAVAVMAAGDIVEAELRFQNFLLQYPDYPGAHVNLAIIAAERGDQLVVEARLKDALSIDPIHPAALNQMGLMLRQQGRFGEAEAAYMKAIAASADYALVHYNLGVLYDLYLQRLDDAVLHYERYQELVGDDQQVKKWIVDLKRRISATQRTANVTE